MNDTSTQQVPQLSATTSADPPRGDGYVPALGFRIFTGFYDSVLALTLRENTFKLRLLKQAQIRAGDKVFDLGCGTGTLALLAKQAVPMSEVIGLDRDLTVLSMAKRKSSTNNWNVHLHCGWSHELPFGDDRFDRILSSLFFHHLTPRAKRQTLLEAFRVLKRGGQLHVADWGKPANSAMRVLFYSIQLLDGFETTRENVAGGLPGLMVEAGFHNVEVRGTLSTIYGTLALYSGAKAIR